MNGGPGGSTPPNLVFQIKALVDRLPAHSEVARLLTTLDDAASDEASRDRYVGIVAAYAVGGALRLALAAKDTHTPKEGNGFADHIDHARNAGIVTAAEADELHRIRHVRNMFAHAIAPIGFDDPTIQELTRLFWNHPVSNWAEYFAPIFPARHRFAIVCGAFVAKLNP